MVLQKNPFDEELELAVLGTAFIEMANANEIAAKCNENDFYKTPHKHIFNYIKKMVEKNEEPDYKDVDPVMVSKMAVIFSSVNLQKHIKELKRYSHLRSIKNICLNVLDDLNDPDVDVEEVIGRVETKLFTLKEFNGDIRHIYDFTESVINNYDRFTQTQYFTGIYDIDNKIRLLDGMPFFFAGLPGGGKSSFIINMLIENSKHCPVGFFSQEMSGDLTNFRSGFTAGDRTKMGFERYKNGIEKLKGKPFYIDETTALTPYQLKSKTLRMVHQYGIRMIALDYIQLAEGEGKTVFEKETSISKTIKNLSKETKTCWIIISQMHKASFRAKKRDMSDLKGSGQFIQDARGIYFIEGNENNENVLEFWCAKQSYGRANWTEKLYFDKENNLFSGYTEEEATDFYYRD